MVNGLNEYEYQNDCVEYLFDKTTSPDSKKIITVKAPTGAGKTVILIKYVNFYLNNTGDKVAFIWLCPGKGDLEVQSREKMEELMPSIDARDLPYSMLLGFDSRSVTFVNWELVTNKKNNALKDSERKNLFDRIDDAHNDGIKFILIIDEEHLNNTKKAKDIIDKFDPIYTIRVSATANKVSHHEFYEIPEDEVIDAGLITRAIYVNEGVMEHDEIENDYDYLLDLADAKRKELLSAYEMVGADVRPLVLIQFPAGQPETIKAVEEKLASMGYTYDNGLVNIWMSDDKIKSDDLTANNGTPAFLLMKQAVSTGWDCPRAKILVKLREGGSEDFQIQTIGRIRRMPERKHYVFPDCLDLCYIYTLDEKYKQGLMTEMDKAYQVRKLFLKKGFEDFTLVKEMRNLDEDSGLGERELLKLIYDHYTSKYKLGTIKVENQKTLSMNGYNFSHEIDSKVIQGEFRSGEAISSATNSQRVSVKTKINTHTHGIQLMHSVDEIKKITAIPAQRVRNILQRLFRKGKRKSWKLLALDTSDFYAFIINNIHKLKEEFREIMATQDKQLSFIENAKTVEFKIPETELYKYTEVKQIKPMTKNVYEGYTNEFLPSEARKSTSERLFERFCERADSVEWIYKNGDSGQQYLSIVYVNGIRKQWLFYPDYIIKTTDGNVWIIETKGGMQAGHTKNIDRQVENKFNAFKEYAKKYNLHWGFVRDIDEELYINNTVYTEEMSGDNWIPLGNVLS